LDQGLNGSAPCCGPTCEMVRCLEFSRLVLNSLGEPLENEGECDKDENSCDNGDDCSGTDTEISELDESEQQALLKQLGVEELGLRPHLPPRGACCGRGCSEDACFSFLLNVVVQIQFPIQQTITAFNKSRPEDSAKLESILGSILGSTTGDGNGDGGDGDATAKEPEKRDEL